jgi:hypothetical protein
MRTLRKGEYRQVKGEFYGTPKELWGFRTRSAAGRPESVARDFLAANAALLGIEPDLSGIRHQKTIESLGAAHVIFQQVLFDRRVHRAYVTVHVDKSGRVFLSKNRSIPRDLLPRKPDRELTEREATGRARAALPRSSRRATLQTTELLWFPHGKGLRPAWRIRLARHRPPEEWIVYVDARTGRILSRYDNLSAVNGRARVFDPSPVTALGGAERLLGQAGRTRRPPDHAYRTVVLRGLKGNGRLEGRRVTTSPTDPRRRVLRRSHDFRFENREKGFEEAMVYHHVDAAVRYLESLGYRGRRAIFVDAIGVDVNGTREDNSWYSPWLKQLTFGTGAIDDAEDAETILHELGHAIQDAICPDFGQSAEAAAMGEGFGDYFAASFFADRKPPRYRAAIITWDGLFIGIEEGSDPPCLRRVDERMTFADFDERGDEHENGKIWAATLWEIHESLGRDVADRIIIESHFQLDGFTTFARGARAIIDADRNLFAGRNADVLRGICRRRRIGPI